MSSTLSLTVRRDGNVAIVALRGALSMEGAARALGACRVAAIGARHLEVSLADLRLYDVSAVGALVLALTRWCERRCIDLTVAVRSGMLVTGSLQSRGSSETGSRKTAVFP
jgi:hypothetical protein